MAERIRELGIDVLVDLAGLTSNHRVGVVARRPAPVQISYMGYPATTGSGFHGYMVADGIVVLGALRRRRAGLVGLAGSTPFPSTAA